jgi:hypothetical protein
MPSSDDAFDLVVHPDTLEHAANRSEPQKECRRVLWPGAVLCFTIPSVVERLSRSRTGLPRVRMIRFEAEFGAEMWTYVLRAGFSALSINAIDDATALAFTAGKVGPLILASHDRTPVLSQQATSSQWDASIDEAVH